MSYYNCFAMKENSSIEWFSANLCLLKLLHELCVWFYKICLKQNKTKIPSFKEPQKIISGNQITINKDNEIEKLKESLDVAKKETEFYKERNQNEVEKTKNATTNSDKELSAIINNLQENCIESKKLAQSYLLKNIELEEENKKLRLKNNKLQKEQSTAKIVNFPNNTKSKGDSSKSILLKAIKQMGTTKAFITQNTLFDFLYGNKRQITYSYKLNELSMFGQYKMPRNSYNIILQELLDDNKIKFNGCYIQFTEN
ncbi:MAG: hypothetical protein LUH05_09065 [Candidatus Gastranaerophilales bacterium]|nr:hypothetical protein [Candidatus Gastranaerophilales bacterium]